MSTATNSNGQTGAEAPQIYEIRIRKASELSSEAQTEILTKLTEIKSTQKGFKYEGYAKVVYAKASPLRVIGVDPIEGTIIDYARKYG